jgi:hypothetical protein
MQVVGKIQAVAATRDGLADEIGKTIEQWAGRKFDEDESGNSIVRRSGVAAIFDKRVEAFDTSKLIRFDVLEPIPGGQLQTQVRVLNSPEFTQINCTLSMGGDGSLAPLQIDLYAPQFIRKIIGLGANWEFSKDTDRLVPQFINVGESDIEVFLRLLRSPHRRLPLVVVSEFEGRTIAGDLHLKAASDLCGLGHTCRISREASWAMTTQLDREWSVYNGAVRLFWPFLANREIPRNHPLWTYDWLTRRGDTEPEIRDWLRRQLRERLFEASTFLADNPAFATFERGLDRARRDEARKIHGSPDDALKAQVQALQTELREREKEIETLQSNFDALTIALRSQAPAFEAAEDDDLPAESVAEAVEVARRKFAGRLAFADDIADQLKSLNTGAGPPEKIFRYLRTLADLSSSLETGPIGNSIPNWLREAGVEASGESETVKKSRDAKRQRTFRIGGDDIYCEFHAKPTDGVPPDLCVRIYFALSDDAPRVRVGYVGRHFD